ncbi:DUF3080 domain-containing protein [Photobacterium chitinilyticum]|uniref:DUF3080 domain-containing protein n=1 Tax=Photobacterium chitinilyticum TaxID=2485123 RepID=A0A3S3QRI4_9GAMM|nr:DUF3080 domain-containing protein [Photobacterium chitinilyticum]RWX57070.1 DUF3080 domain-containing protein [Photobacterium chitinilyticum]
MPYRQLLVVILVFTFLALIGCEDNSAEDSLKTYNERLANVLDVSPSQAPDTDIPQLAKTRELALPIEDIRIGLLDAYELRKCGLFQLIAERNSVLGKVQDKTHRFRYELLFMDGLENCLETLPQDADILVDIKQLHQLKQQQLPIYLWNMLTTGEEWRKQFRIYRRAFTLGNFPGSVENQEAMRYLLAIHTALMNGETVPPKQAERLLVFQQQIHTHRYFGQLVYSIARSRDWLNSSTRLLESNESRIICGTNRNQQKAIYLSNVFHRFFASDIQPYFAELDSQYRQIQISLQVLLQPPSAVSTKFAPYYQSYIAGELHSSFREAIINHVKFWQRTFKRCQIKLGVQIE